MGDVKFNCPSCGQSLEAPDDMAGTTCECPACKKTLQVPLARPRLALKKLPPSPPRPPPPPPILPETVAVTTPTPDLLGALRTQFPRVYKHVVGCLMPGEQVMFWFCPIDVEGVVALSDRVCIVKVGWDYGAMFGAKVGVFYYRDIASVEVRQGGFLTAVEIVTMGNQGIRTTGTGFLDAMGAECREATNTFRIRTDTLQQNYQYVSALQSLVGRSK